LIHLGGVFIAFIQNIASTKVVPANLVNELIPQFTTLASISRQALDLMKEIPSMATPE
jgi:hypothetical protein